MALVVTPDSIDGVIGCSSYLADFRLLADDNRIR